MRDRQKVIIVGGSVGGTSVAVRLRALDENADIILIEKEKDIALDQIDVRTHEEAVWIDREDKKIKIKNLLTGLIYVENYDKLVLSMGSVSIIPPIEGMTLENVFVIGEASHKNRMQPFLRTRPQECVVIGAGRIGIETAVQMQGMGVSVTILEQSHQILPLMDMDMAGEIYRYIESKGIRLILNHTVAAVQKEENRLLVIFDDEKVMADMVVVAVGQKPVTMLAKDAGLQVNPEEAIVVNSQMLTSDAHIYALGSAVESFHAVTAAKASSSLSNTAMRQASVVADNICGMEKQYKGIQNSWAIDIFEMSIAATGINEKTAKQLNISFDKSFTLSKYPETANMAVKIIFHPDSGEILGSQIVGFKGVRQYADIFAVAVRSRMSVYDLADLELSSISSHPLEKMLEQGYDSVFQSMMMNMSLVNLTKDKNYPQKPSFQPIENENKVIQINACGLLDPSPIVKLSDVIKSAKPGDSIEIATTDPGFTSDVSMFCMKKGIAIEGISEDRGVQITRIVLTEVSDDSQKNEAHASGTAKSLVVFSDDLDKAIALFMIANSAVAMGSKVSMFFTFWGLNILRKPKGDTEKKDFLSRIFDFIMPSHAAKLRLSKMNFGGLGRKVLQNTMHNKNIDSLEELMAMAQSNGVEFIACARSMEILGIRKNELIQGVKLGGTATMLSAAEHSDTSLFF